MKKWANKLNRHFPLPSVGGEREMRGMEKVKQGEYGQCTFMYEDRTLKPTKIILSSGGGDDGE
jgi:hypothetical protein